MNTSLRVAGLLAGCLLLAGSAAAAKWPTRPITIISTGSSDIAPRILGAVISGPLGQQIVSESRPGAAGVIAADYTLRQPADGYTFLNITSALMAASHTMKIDFDVMRDFRPVSLLATSPFILAVNPSLPVQSLAQLIALAKKRPGELNFSATSPGSSSDLVAELFKAQAHLNIVHVSYKSMKAALLDAIGGHVELTLTVGDTAVSQIKAQKLRALAVSTAKRSPVLPHVPTFRELGYNIVLPGWFGLVARAGTPRAIVNRLSAEVVKAMHVPSVREKFVANAMDPVGNTPRQFRAFMKDNLRRWGEAARVSGVERQ